MYTLDEQERQAYQQGNITLAGALAAQIDAENELAAAEPAREELLDEIAHLKRILADALADDIWRAENGDDIWRERAEAAVSA